MDTEGKSQLQKASEEKMQKLLNSGGSRKRISLILIVIGFVLPLLVRTPQLQISTDLRSLIDGIAIGIFGSGITFWILDWFVERCDEQARKAQLIILLGSGSSDFASAAARELHLRYWHYAEVTERAYLRRANLQGVDLRDFNLKCAYCKWADFRDARVYHTNFKGADLSEANMENVQRIEDAIFDQDTIMPNGDRWTPTNDLKRFTERGHSSFYRSDDPRSPSYEK